MSYVSADDQRRIGGKVGRLDQRSGTRSQLGVDASQLDVLRHKVRSNRHERSQLTIFKATLL